MSIVHYPKKLRMRDIEGYNTEVLANFRYSRWAGEEIAPEDYLYRDYLKPRPGEDRETYFRRGTPLSHQIHGSAIAVHLMKKFGKPNIIMQGYESTPGVWVFDDTENHVRWFIWSDGFRKNHFKGTQIELVFTQDRPRSFSKFRDILHKFFVYIGIWDEDQNLSEFMT